MTGIRLTELPDEIPAKAGISGISRRLTTQNIRTSGLFDTFSKHSSYLMMRESIWRL